MIQFVPEMPKAPAETLPLFMEFSKPGWLRPGESITAATWTCEVYTGIDPNPGAMISGLATIDGTKVLQDVVGGLEGVIYLLLCTFTTNQDRTLVGRGLLKVSSRVM